MISLMKRLRGKMLARHSVDAQYDAIYILGFRFLARKRNCSMTQKSSSTYAEELPVKRTKILLRSDGNNYSGAPKYIANEIIRRKLPWELVWIVDKNVLIYQDDFPPSIRLDMIGTPESIEDSATAKIWIDNTWRTFLLDNGVSKKKEQIYIQTWRGSYGIKKFGLGRNNFNPDTWKRIWADIRQMDYFISHSPLESNFYRRTFRAQKILELGHPNNDIFFIEDRGNIRCRVFDRLGISVEEKLVLYAPTRYDNRPRSAFNMNYSAVLSALGEKFGGKWIMAARMPHQASRECFIPWGVNLINVTRYADIQELLVAADVCISDYSSCIFDFLHTGRPAFIYASDHASFERNRGLYYPLAQAPFPMAENNEQMLNNIRSFDQETYSQKVSLFLKEKKSIEDGYASKRVVDYLECIINK